MDKDFVEKREAKQIQLVKLTTGVNDLDNLTDQHFDQLQDNLLNTAQQADDYNETIEELKQAGFENVATFLSNLMDASLAYQWSRENL